jgi:hypothetical protein
VTSAPAARMSAAAMGARHEVEGVLESIELGGPRFQVARPGVALGPGKCFVSTVRVQ